MTKISQFSSQYYVIDADTVTYGGDDAICGNKLYNGLRWYVNEPLIHVGSGHYWLESEAAVPADTIALPKYVEHSEDEPVLVAKEEASIQHTFDNHRCDD